MCVLHHAPISDPIEFLLFVPMPYSEKAIKWLSLALDQKLLPKPKLGAFLYPKEHVIGLKGSKN